MDIEKVHIDEPPLLIKGNVKPVIGIIPTTIPIFIITWHKNIAITPDTIKAPSLSLAKYATIVPLINIVVYAKTTNALPINPHSSHILEKMKSLTCCGMKFNCDWLPFKKPSPNSPPLPTAISDCMILYPELNSSHT